MPYRSPLAELRFHLHHVAGYAQVAATERFADATSDTVDAVLSEAARLWMSLPSTWAQIGYDGFATGGEGWFQGYDQTVADHTELWRLPMEGVG